jgi:hypothetical protein
MTIRTFAAGLVASLLLGATLAYAQENKKTAAAADMSGLWILQDPGSGSWSEWFDNVPKPQLQPDIIADNQRMAASEAAGNVVNRAPRTAACPIGNLPMMMASSPPLNIVASRDEVLIGAESNRGRFIYTDGRSHPDVKDPFYVPTGFGHSIGRWEGDTLVVDTIGFPPRVCDSRRPVMLVPGGGRAKDTTHLVERYRLAGPDELSVTFSWEDATVFLAPHTYSYTYKRLPEGIPIENNEDPAAAQPDRQYTTTKAEK